MVSRAKQLAIEHLITQRFCRKDDCKDCLECKEIDWCLDGLIYGMTFQEISQLMCEIYEKVLQKALPGQLAIKWRKQ